MVLCLNFKVKFIHSEKATIFSEISTADLSYVVTVKATVEILQNFVALSEYMNFKVRNTLGIKLWRVEIETWPCKILRHDIF